MSEPTDHIRVAKSSDPVRSVATGRPNGHVEDRLVTAPAAHHACCVARPGDVLIVGLATPTPRGTVEKISEGLRRGLPDTIKICVIDNVGGFQVVRNEGGN